MDGWSKKEELNIYHGRANHEDILNLGRTTLFISVNAFFAIALGLVDYIEIKIVFALMVLIITIFWCLWAPNVREFIRQLRDAGEERPDEKAWRASVGQSETRHKGLKDPLTIINKYIPRVFLIGWFIIIVYLSYQLCKSNNSA